MTEKKESFHILLPMWGRKFIDYSLKFGLTSLFAPGNLPWLAERASLTMVFLTKEEDIEFLARTIAKTRFAQLCDIEYEPIDDLIMHGEFKGFAINLAYARGVARQKEKMVSTRFIFFNADFILADNSMKKIWNLVQEGNDVILGTSFRVTEETALGPLQKLLEENSGAIPARELAGFALRHRHPTIISKTLNQDKFSCLQYNQLYWQVDESTLLARCYLATLFCLKPTTRMEHIDSYIDYNMIPTFCPDAKMTAISDSDDFFLLELQDRKHEIRFFRSGNPVTEKVVQYLSEWSTSFHRAAGSFETVIHGGELPANFSLEQKKLHAVLLEIQDRLCDKSVDPKLHDHWVGGILAWLRLRRSFESEFENHVWPFSGISMPLCQLKPFLIKKIYGFDAFAATLFLGLPPKYMPWHPLARNFAAIRKILYKNIGHDEEYLFIADDFTYDGLALARGKPRKALALDAANGHMDKLYPGQKFSTCFIAVKYEYLDAAKILQNIKDFLLPNARVILFFGRDFERLTIKNRPFMDAYYCAMRDIEPYSPQITRIGNMRGINYVRHMEDAMRNMRANPVWHGPRLFFLAIVSLLNNIYCSVFPDNNFSGATGILAEFTINVSPQ